MGSLIKSLVRMIIILVIIISPVSPIESGYIKRLSALGGQGASYAFAYDGLGNRYQQIVDGKPQTYALDLAGGLSQVLYDEEFSYIYGLERLAQQANTGEYETFLPDRLGSVRQVASASGFPSFAQEFDPYGSLSSYAGAGGSAFGYAGEFSDPSGLIYLRARYYSPAQGRFITRDPFRGLVSQPASLNPYSYALNNPVLYTDPSGEFVETIFDAAMLGYDLFTIIDKASRGCSIGLTDWGALGLDALSLAVPFLPAGGMAIRFAAHADDIGDLSKIADKIPETLKLLPKPLRSKFPYHHIFPKRPDLAQKFTQRGININEHLLELPIDIHKQIHSSGPRGGAWNRAWEIFFENNPQATKVEIYKHAGWLIYDFRLDNIGKMIP